MKRLITISVALLVVATVAAAQAQQGQGRGGRGGRGFGGGGGGGETRLLSAQSVIDELKITDDQKKQIEEFREKQRASFGSFRDLSEDERRKRFEESATATKEALAKILTPEQQKRLKQINLQQMGSRVLAAPEVASSLNLTDDQKSKLQELNDKIREEMQALGGGAGGGQGADREANRKKFEEMRTANRERTLSILTPDQKTKLDEMLGEPFKGEIPRGGFGGGGGRGRGGNGQGRQGRNRNNPDSA